MKTKLLLFLFAVAAVASAADTNPLSGKWQIHIQVADHEADQTCTFIQNGNDLTGSCISEFGGEDKLSGKIDDAKVTWKTSGGQVTLTFRGTLSKTADATGLIVGSLTVEEYGVEGEFTASQSK